MTKHNISLLLLCSLFLSACSLNEGEPRVTMCQKTVQILLETPEVTWVEHHQEAEAYSQITVNLSFNVTDGNETNKHTDSLSAVCVYAYIDIAEYDVADQEYENSPTDVYINDKMVGRYTLTKAVNRVMANAIKGIFTE